MCSGSKRKSNPAAGFDMDADKNHGGLPCRDFSPLLEFSASDDLHSFRRSVEEEGLDVNEPGLWYGRRIGSNKMGLEVRTPLMIAALYGSKAVLTYILETLRFDDVNKPCGSDGATALHCAVAVGNADVVKLLLQASADPNSLDVNGNRPADLILRRGNSLERLLKGVEGGGEGGGEEIGSLPDEIDVSTPKKEYPIDLTLPDIKNGIYGTDEFRMYTFKVKPCSRAYSHDWTECPFVHPGENARRRDPRKYLYTCVPCPEFRKGSCRQGDSCEYAHGIFECWLHPAQYRTRLCKDETNCTRRVCFFAHKTEELRPLYASTGSAVPSPRSSASYSGNGFDISSLTPPLTSPGGSPSAVSLGGWPTSVITPPPLQLPGSRLKSSLSARDIDVDMELMGMEAHRRRRQLMDEFAGLNSPSGWTGDQTGKFNKMGGVNPTRLDDLYGAVDPLLLSQLQDMNLKVRSSYPAAVFPSSPVRSSGMEQIGFNSRAAAFAKRSQSFVGRSSVNHHTGFPSSPGKLSDWGSPDGKLDWKIQGEELSKFRKSASFGYRSSEAVNEGSGMRAGQMGVGGPNQEQGHPDLGGPEMLPAWMEQLYSESEQMVAS
ncbi:Zinc finger CCCH domain-containing protein 66 [Linum perenne]